MDIMLYAGGIYKGEKLIGTGFVIDPEDCLLLTARHVLDEFRDSGSNSVDGFFFRLFISENKIAIKSQVASKLREQEDVVLLELSERTEKVVKAPTLISYAMPTSDVWTVGYAEHEKLKGEYKPAQGKLSGYTTKNGVRVYELDIDGIYKGMSGSPVMLGDKGIIGILTTRINEKHNLTAWVTPVNAFAGLDDRIKLPRTAYLQNLIDTLSRRDPVLDMDDYVPVRVAVTTPDKDSQPQWYDNIFDVLTEYPKFNLIGDAGSGKTTALKRMAVHMAKEALKNPDACMPVWIELSDWSLEQSFTSFLDELLSTTPNKSIKNYYPMENLLEDSKIVLFLDQFDEVEGKNVSKLNKWVTQTEIRTYISCRDTYFIGNWKINIPTARIEPLNTLEAYQFADHYFKSTELADEFMSTIAPDGYIDYKTDSHVSQLASNPLFLIMMLADYRDGNWRISRDQIRIPTIWNLFREILKQLWASSRVPDALQEKKHLALEYNDIDIVIAKLSKLAFQFSGDRSIPKSEIQKIFPEEVINILNDSRIIKMNPSMESYRFLHSLFSDYFVAHEIRTENIGEYVQRSEWLSPLLILSTRNESDRQVIQEHLLKVVVGGNQDSRNFSFQKQEQVLGDIGDRYAIGLLLSIFEQNPKRTDLFRPLAKIADRLPDHDDQKAKVIQILKKVMFSAVWMNHDANGEVLGGLDWLMGDYTSATEAMALIKTSEALDAILEILDRSARHYDDEIASGALFRQQWFSDYLSSMGEWVIPKLLEAIDSDHPHVTTTIANALLKINRPLDVSKIGKVMLSHPVPMVRANLAATLGRLKGQDSIVFLEKALEDNQVWSRGTFAIRWRHFFVSDSAAEGLARIGGRNAVEILAKHNYQSDGTATPELLLARLESGFDVEHRDSLRTQIASVLAGLGRWDLLLPRLGHIDLYALDGYASPCPIAEALIQRYEDAHAEDRMFFEDQLTDYVDPTDEILEFLDKSTDLTTRCWALILLGSIGSSNSIPTNINTLDERTTQPVMQDTKILPVLRKYFLDKNHPDVQDAAGYGLGCYIKRQKINSQSAMEFAAEILNLTDSISPRNYSGFGMGLMKIISLCIQEGSSYSQVMNMIRTCLLQKINGQSILDSKIALDALETISIFCPAFMDETVSSVVEVSPTYFCKMANKEYQENENTAAYPGMKDRISYDTAFENYKRALQESELSQASWKKPFAEADWEELGLRKDRLFHQLGKVYVVNEKWQDAFDAFKRSLDSISLQNFTVKDKHFFAIYACSELGNLQMGFLDLAEESLDYFAQALSLSKEAHPTEFTDMTLYSVLCNAILNYQKFFIPRQEHDRVVEIGMESEFLLGNIKYMSDDNLAMIYLNTSTSLILLERMDESNRYAQMAHEKLLRSSNRQMKIGALLRIAELQKVMGENAQAETNILEAIASAKRSGDGALEARSQMALAHSLDSDIETDRIMAAYERALWLFGDDEHERVLQEKAGIYHEIAVLYQKQGKYEDAEAAFRTAIHLVQRITPDFPNMPYVIQAEYAKFLHLTDRHDAAIDLLIHLARELMQRGMNPGVVEQALAEIDTPEGSRVPSAAAKQWAEALVYVSQGRIDEAEFVEKMYAMLQHFNENGWRNEEMYVLSLLDLWADLKRQVITEANPYYKFYQWAKEHYK